MLVYVCSPCHAYAARSLETNLAEARAYCRQVVLLGHFPLAPHMILTQFLDDDLESERQLGLSLGLDVLEKCDVVWVFGDHISHGMRGEIRAALAAGTPIAWFPEGKAWVGKVGLLPELKRRVEANA